MALTESQWVHKLKAWVPGWWFEQEPNATAIITGMARVFSALEADADAQVALTYLDQSEAPELDAIGDERNVDRLTDELDPAYAIRIKTSVNTTSKAMIKQLVDALLLVGTCDIREGFGPDNIFASRGSYLGRHEYLNEYSYNTFTIVIDPQIHAPLSYCSRGYYLGRGNYAGSELSSSTIYANIEAAVTRAKAFGVFYKIVERA